MKKNLKKELKAHLILFQKRERAEERYSTVEQYLKEWVNTDLIEEKLRNLKKIKIYAFKEFTATGCITMLFTEVKKCNINIKRGGLLCKWANKKFFKSQM